MTEALITFKRSPLKEVQCCEGVDLECFGCNPVLFAQGQSCDKQTTKQPNKQNNWSPERRDCFCDSSCILFEDCCDDHFDTCTHLYDYEEGIPDSSNCEYLQETESSTLLFFNVRFKF